MLAARAHRARLLRLPERRDRRDQRRLPPPRRRLRPDRARLKEQVGLFRRSEPLHERLAREGGLGAPAAARGRPARLGRDGHPRRATAARVGRRGDGRGRGGRGRPGALRRAPRRHAPDRGGRGRRTRWPMRSTGSLAPPYRAEAVRRRRTAGRSACAEIEVVELRTDPGGRRADADRARRRADAPRRRRLDASGRSRALERARRGPRPRPTSSRASGSTAPSGRSGGAALARRADGAVHARSPCRAATL